MHKVRFGVVGLGFVADAHAAGLLSSSKAAIEAICDVNEERLHARGETWGVRKRYQSFESLLGDNRVDAIDILTPPFLHAQMVKLAAENGKHVLVEKPMCVSLHEADDMIASAQKADVKLMVAESYVFLTSHVKARTLIDRDMIGEPMHMRMTKGTWVSKSNNHSLPPTTMPWREDPMRSGGGPYPWAMDHFPHVFATARYFMKERGPERVYSMVITPPLREGEKRARRGDIAAVCWEYAGGGRHGAWLRVDSSLNAFDAHGFRTTINGTRGSIKVLGEGGGPAVSGVRTPPIVLEQPSETRMFGLDEGPDRVWVSEVNYYDRAHTNEMEHFITCVLQDSDPRYGGEDGRKDLQATLATIMSAVEDRPVHLSSLPNEWKASDWPHDLPCLGKPSSLYSMSA